MTAFLNRSVEKMPVPFRLSYLNTNFSVAKLDAMIDPFRAISLALEGLRGASEVLDKAKIEAAVVEIRKALLEAQQNSLELQRSELESTKTISGLEKRIRDLETDLAKVAGWENLAACYTLRETRPASAIWIREYDETEGRKRGFREVHHWACANCFDQGKRSILTARTTGSLALTCPICKQTAQHKEERSQGLNQIGTPDNW